MYFYEVLEAGTETRLIEIPSTLTLTDLTNSLIASRIIEEEDTIILVEAERGGVEVVVDASDGTTRVLTVVAPKYDGLPVYERITDPRTLDEFDLEGDAYIQSLADSLPHDERFVYFYGGIFSQWTYAPTCIGGVLYDTAEQYMMACKAMTFHDYSTLRRIMQTEDPAEQKELGRGVAGYVNAEWRRVAPHVVYRASVAKFTQLKDMRDYLLSTTGKLLVEASPTDRIWGIGLNETDERILDPSQWRGDNLLGEIITQVRLELEAGEGNRLLELAASQPERLRYTRDLTSLKSYLGDYAIYRPLK